MFDYLMDWLHNLMAAVATLSGIGLLTYAAARQFSPDVISNVQQALGTVASLISGINLWPVVALALLLFVLGSTLPHRDVRI